MSTLAGFRRRTVESAEVAARLYFEPLSILKRFVIPGRGDESRSFRKFRPLAVGLTSHWEHRLVAWRKRVEQAGSLEVRRAEARAALAWSLDASRELELLRKASEADYVDLMEQWHASVSRPEHKMAVRPLYYQTLLSVWFRAAAWMLTAVEVGLVAFFLSSNLQFEFFVAVGIGAIVILILTTGATATFSALILAGLESQPTRARQILLPQIAVIGSSVFLLVGALLFARVTGHMSAQLFQYFLVGLMTMTPVFVALLESGARLFGWSSELSRRQQKLEALRIEIDTLSIYLN
ncbi:MAG: hypothetical protein DMF60_19505, partial [Acidobacteria bacterium]